MGYEIRRPEHLVGTMIWTAYGDLAEAGPNGLEHHSRDAVQGTLKNAATMAQHAEREAMKAKLEQAMAQSFHRVAADELVRQQGNRQSLDAGRYPVGMGGSDSDPDALYRGLQRPSSTAERAAHVSNMMVQADYARMAGAAISAADLAKVAEEDEILVPSNSRRNHLRVRRTSVVRKVK